MGFVCLLNTDAHKHSFWGRVYKDLEVGGNGRREFQERF